jgi:hypothetical protein
MSARLRSDGVGNIGRRAPQKAMGNHPRQLRLWHAVQPCRAPGSVGFSLDELQAHLENGLFPIVFVRADLLPWATWSGFHALVLVEITPTDLALFDPALDDGPTRLARDSFLIAWEEFDCLAAVISRQI